jgi:hypothetical protein
LDRFRKIYNEQRPHRALDRATPDATYRATTKATVEDQRSGEYRVRFDTVDRFAR